MRETIEREAEAEAEAETETETETWMISGARLKASSMGAISICTGSPSSGLASFQRPSHPAMAAGWKSVCPATSGAAGVDGTSDSATQSPSSRWKCTSRFSSCVPVSASAGIESRQAVGSRRGHRCCSKTPRRRRRAVRLGMPRKMCLCQPRRTGSDSGAARRAAIAKFTADQRARHGSVGRQTTVKPRSERRSVPCVGPASSWLAGRP